MAFNFRFTLKIILAVSYDQRDIWEKQKKYESKINKQNYFSSIKLGLEEGKSILRTLMSRNHGSYTWT